jgi:uncharacterized membrane protein
VKADGTRRGAGRGASVEGIIARVLLAGGLVSIALVLLGLALYAAHGGFAGHTLELHRIEGREGGRAGEAFVSFAEVAAGLSARPINGLAVVALGLALLLMTPVLGVAAAIPGFLAARDYRYAAIAAIVLAMLVLSLLFTGGAG